MSRRLEQLRAAWKNGDDCDCDRCYLLSIIELLEQQIQAQILTQLDPSNETEYLRCWCIDEIIDDAGSTLISSPTPGCPVHGKKPGP